MIQIRNLKKSYGSFEALRGLTMEIEQGELFGFVGPNGAGKTTTMKIIAGLLQADSGEIMIHGERMAGRVQRLKEKIGYVPDFFGVYDNLKVQEYLEFYASLYGMDGKAARHRTEELLQMVSMAEEREELVDGMSRGKKQKLCVARALVNDPELLILDEPASGMEPKARMQLRELLTQLCIDGKTIIISSHNLKELSESCTSIGIIHEGILLAQGRVDEILKRQKERNPYVLQYLDFPEEAMEVLKSNSRVKNITKQEKQISFLFFGEEPEVAQLLAEMTAAGAQVISFMKEEGSLERMFLEITV